MRRHYSALFILLLFTLVLSGCNLMSIAGLGTEAEPFSVIVNVQSDDGGGVPGVTVYEGDSIVGVTDSSGVLQVSGLTASTTYRVEKLNWTFDPSQQPIRATSSTVTFVGSEATDTYSAAIRVQDVDGNPLADVSIARGGFTLGATDSTGTFTISGLVDPEVVFPVRPGWEFFPREIQISPTNNNVTFRGQQTEFTFEVVVDVRDGAGVGINNVLVYSGDQQLTRTGSNGLATVRGLTGPTNLRVERAGWQFSPDNVVATEDTATVFFTGLRDEPDSFDVQVRVVDSQGNPIPSTELYLDSQFEKVTDSDGQALLTELTGTLQLRPRNAGWDFDPVSSDVDSTTQLITFEGTPVPDSYTVTVTVLDSDIGGSGIFGVSVLVDDVLAGMTGTNGTVEVRGLVGEPTITVDKAGWVFDPVSVQVNKKFTEVNFTPAIP